MKVPSVLDAIVGKFARSPTLTACVLHPSDIAKLEANVAYAAGKLHASTLAGIPVNTSEYVPPGQMLCVNTENCTMIDIMQTAPPEPPAMTVFRGGRWWRWLSIGDVSIAGDFIEAPDGASYPAPIGTRAGAANCIRRPMAFQDHGYAVETPSATTKTHVVASEQNKVSQPPALPKSGRGLGLRGLLSDGRVE